MSKRVTIGLLVTLTLLSVTFTAAQSPPAAPTNLSIEVLMNRGIRLNWDWVSGAHGYRVYKAVDTFPFFRIGQVNINHYEDPWVPPGHVYRYYVTAFNQYGESDPSEDITYSPDSTPPPRPRGFIAGHIEDDSTGLPIPGAHVRFFRMNALLYFREAWTDPQGNYIAKLDTGKYLVYASKWGYIPEWFDDALTPLHATFVTVTHQDTSTADFGLKRILPPPYSHLVNVSGTVVDSTTNQPLAGAWVVIMRKHHQFNMMQYQDGPLFGARDEVFNVPYFGTLRGVIRVTRTDSNGYYKFTVPAPETYIVLGFMRGYIPEFFKDKRTPFDADRLHLRHDTSGIDFTLVPNPNVQNSLAGTVENVDGFGVASRVVLFIKTSINTLIPIRCTITDSVGNYSFDYLHAGYYYVKAVPFTEYAPAWYDEDSCGVHSWMRADSVVVSGATTGADICVEPLQLSGFASIRGIVNDNRGGGAVQGATVYALASSTNTIVGYDITEDDGSFELVGLAPGTYQIVVDKEGYDAPEGPAYNVDASNDYTLENVQVGVTDVTLGVNDGVKPVPSAYSLEQNYPNPFNPVTSFRFEVPVSGFVSVKVFDVLGKEVSTLVSEVKEPGEYTVRWDAANAPSGVYFYRLQAGSFTETKKMLLMK